MKQFGSIESFVRKNFILYIFLRRLAPFICRFIDLEEGFSFSKYIVPNNDNYVVLDVGSNDGTSIQMFRRYFPDFRIVAIDPIEKPRFRLNNVTLIKTAIGEAVGVRNLITPVINGRQLTQYSSFYKEKMISQICSDMSLLPEQVSVIITEVKFEIIDNLNIEPFFIKVDVEGAELEVLRGAINIIAKFCPVILIEIQNKETYNEVTNFLGIYGYINIEPGITKNNSGAPIQIDRIEKFKQNTNNYVWINPDNETSWRFKKALR
jgi:FkbM family methyltransferase